MDTIKDRYETQSAGPKPGPKYRVLAEAIRDAVGAGALAPGEKLPPVRDLAWDLGITPGTAARAYTILTDERLLKAEVGRGTFVAGPEREVTLLPDPFVNRDPYPHGTNGVGLPVSLMSPGMPDVGQPAFFKQLLGRIAADPPSGIMHYPTREAFRPAREAVKHWLRNTPLGMLTESDIVLSHGGQNAILLVMQAILVGRRPVVLVEELAYPGFRRAAELLRAEVVPVAMDAHGVCPDALEAVAGGDAQILCTTPEAHNPTCLLTPESRRREIVEVARRHNLQILEDDCYRLNDAQAPSYRQLAPERGWYISSLSKSLTPALRVGFAIAPEGRGADLRRAAEHGFFGLATPLADLTAALLTDPKAEQFAHDVSRAFDARLRIVLNHLGGFELKWRSGVPFVWLSLPEGWRTAAFCRAAEAEGVRVRSAEDFALRDGRVPHAVRISLNAAVSEEMFDNAIGKLAALLHAPPESVEV